MKSHVSKCSIAEHHASDAEGSTLLKLIIEKSPAHYLWNKENPEESTPAQAFGSAIHQAILEPSLFEERMVVEPKFEGTGSRAARETWHLENHGKTILKADQYEIIKGIKKSISRHKQASKLISEGHAEESIFWTDPETGIKCKARPDFKHAGHILVDIKSTNDASDFAFRSQIAAYLYHLQGGMYTEGATHVFDHKFDEFVIIAVEKNPPFAVNTFSLGIETLDDGRTLFAKALRTLKECKESGIYPAYDDSKIHPIGLPPWGFKNVD